MTIYFQPVQDVQISTQSSRSQYQYTLTGTDSARGHACGPASWSPNCAAIPMFRDVSSEAQEGGLRACARRRPPAAGQLGVSLQAVTDTLNDAFAQRQISTIYGQANQYRVVLEALPMYQRDPSILSKLYLPGALAGAQVPLVGGGDPDAHHGTAGDFASGAVSRPCRSASTCRARARRWAMRSRR